MNPEDMHNWKQYICTYGAHVYLVEIVIHIILGFILSSFNMLVRRAVTKQSLKETLQSPNT